MDPSHLPLRPNVCMLVFNPRFEIFLGRRAGHADVWQFPQGGVEPHLSLEDNVLKELHEELGPPPSRFLLRARCAATHSYEFDPVPDRYRGRWRGQEQSFWIVEFLGEDSEITLGEDPKELSAWRWCTVDEVRALAEPRRLAGYLQPLREFEEYIHAANAGRI